MWPRYRGMTDTSGKIIGCVLCGEDGTSTRCARVRSDRTGAQLLKVSAVTFDRISLAVSRAAGRPWAFALAAVLVVAWAATGPWFGWSDSHSLFINTATTIVTFLMVFLIQNT